MNNNFLHSIFRLFVVAIVVALAALVAGCTKQTLPSGNEQAIKQEQEVGMALEIMKHDPLFVVNGKVVELMPGAKTIRSSVWRIVQPGDVSSIEILKGTAAIAEWGERGTHGVVMITTKGKTKQEVQ